MIPDDFPDEDYFDFPTSLAFGTGPWDKKSVYGFCIGAMNYGFPFGKGSQRMQVGNGIPLLIRSLRLYLPWPRVPTLARSG